MGYQVVAVLLMCVAGYSGLAGPRQPSLRPHSVAGLVSVSQVASKD